MDLLEAYMQKVNREFNRRATDNKEVVQRLNSIYTEHKKGFSNDGNMRHLAEIDPIWFIIDDDLKMYNKLMTEGDMFEASKYMRKFLNGRGKSCKIDPIGKSNIFQFYKEGNGWERNGR